MTTSDKTREKNRIRQQAWRLANPEKARKQAEKAKVRNRLAAQLLRDYESNQQK